MKKLLILLAISMLPACNSRQSTQEITELPQQEVKAQSNQGANSYIERYMKTTFDVVDKNKDGFIVLEELNNSSSFNSFDKNKDGKLSFDEFRKAGIAGGLKKEYFRDNFIHNLNYYMDNKEIFKYSELKKTYEGYITKEQFVEFALKSNATKEPVGVFYVADKNNDGKLSFSEFEDCLFGLGKGLLDGVNNNSNNEEFKVPDNNFTPGFKGN